MSTKKEIKIDIDLILKRIIRIIIILMLLFFCYWMYYTLVKNPDKVKSASPLELLVVMKDDILPQEEKKTSDAQDFLDELQKELPINNSALRDSLTEFKHQLNLRNDKISKYKDSLTNFNKLNSIQQEGLLNRFINFFKTDDIPEVIIKWGIVVKEIKINELKTELESAGNKNQNLRDKIRQLEDSKKRWEKEKTELIAKTEKLENKVDSLQNLIYDKDSIILKQAKIIDALNQKVADLSFSLNNQIKITSYDYYPKGLKRRKDRKYKMSVFNANDSIHVDIGIDTNIVAKSILRKDTIELVMSRVLLDKKTNKKSFQPIIQNKPVIKEEFDLRSGRFSKNYGIPQMKEGLYYLEIRYRGVKIKNTDFEVLKSI